MMRKPTLGRGLADLLGQARPLMAPAPAAPEHHGEELAKLPLDLLQRGRYQPRMRHAHGDARTSWPTPSRRRAWCSRSWCARWRPPGDGGSQRYEIIAGERRWRAAQMAGLSEIPAVIRHIPDEAAIAVALIENIQRENLNPLEEARALERLISEFS